jgi:hypothetical protein
MSDLPFSPSCPLGGQWYVCNSATSSSKFVGCCTSDPCSASARGCTAGALRPASFNSSAYGTFADQECSAGLFYTCAFTKPPFLGCCKSNPCSAGGCPTDDLAGAFLSGDPGKAEDFLGLNASRSSSSAAGTGTAVANDMGQRMDHTGDGTGLSVGAIVGLTVGSVLVLLLLIAASMFICGRQSERKQEPHRQKTLDVLARDLADVRELMRGEERARQYSPSHGELHHQMAIG